MELKEVVWTRRSVRKFKDTPIAHEDLEEILQSATMAPSGVNLQPWYFVALESPEAMEEYRAIMRKGAQGFLPALQARFPTHPEVIEETMDFLSNCGGAPAVVLVFFHKPSIAKDPGVSSHLQSVAAAIQTMLLMAWDKGIASCWTTAPVNAGLGGMLQERYAPDKGAMVAAVCLGYPAEERKAPVRKTDRIVYL